MNSNESSSRKRRGGTEIIQIEETTKKVKRSRVDGMMTTVNESKRVKRTDKEGLVSMYNELSEGYMKSREDMRELVQKCEKLEIYCAEEKKNYTNNIRSILNLLNCPICLEWLEKPSVFKGCGHTFCRECIGLYLEGNTERANGAASCVCPICRKSVACPLAETEQHGLLQCFTTANYTCQRTLEYLDSIKK